MKALIAVSMECSSDPRHERPFKPGYRFDYLISAYGRLLESAGMQAVLLPVGTDPEDVQGLLARVDGLLLSGGSDLDPAMWGEAELEPGGHVQPLGEDERARSRWEHALVEAALAGGLPLLGICRGMQQLNVSLGGSLWQDLERQLGRPGHPSEDPFLLAHALANAAPADELAHALEGARVTSTHHQGLRQVSPQLEILATAAGEADVVEAVRYRGPSFALGVQWHPERMPGEPLTRALLDSFHSAIRHRKATP
jgi:putative glutamine amidotransferase